MGKMFVLFLVFWPMAAAVIYIFAARAQTQGIHEMPWIVAAVEMAAAVVLAYLTLSGGSVTAFVPGICSLGFGFETDGFRTVYTLIIAFMWLMTLLFSPEYFARHSSVKRYYFFNLFTLGSTMGVFLSRDLVTALCFFEVMSFTSFTWVIQEETPAAVRAANTYLAIAVIGGLVALMGLFLLQSTLHTLVIGELYAAAEAYGSKRILYTAGACILAGFGAKAGMFPLHIWLPKAHPVAPAPASALLSGILTKSGLWGVLAISCNLFRYDPAWGTLVLCLGLVTMFLGALLALFSIDLKRTLACSSMSQIGFVLFGVGMMGLLGPENVMAARGVLLHMLNHSVFKLILFLFAGCVFVNTGALDLNAIRGFGRRKPLLMFAYLMGALGIGGVPLFSGYISKTLLHESITAYTQLLSGAAWFGAKASEWVFLISGGLTLAYMTKLYVVIFIERNPNRQSEYDAMTSYLAPKSRVALVLPACIVPFLGVTAAWSMDAIAQLGTDFMHAGNTEEAVHYFTLSNLAGFLITLIIAALIYWLVVRKWMISRKSDSAVYLDRWPQKLDLEDAFYRPVLNLLGFVLGIVCRAVGDIPDALTVLLRRTLLREFVPESDDPVTASFGYRIGHRLDLAAVRSGREKRGGEHYAEIAVRIQTSIDRATRQLTGNLTVALLALCVALCLVFIYMLTLYV